jgi:hypothetical protein
MTNLQTRKLVMLITRKSRRGNSSINKYESRFTGKAGSFPLRQYLRAKDEIISKSVLTLIYAGFGIALFLFSKTVYSLFNMHGQHLHISVKWLTVTVVVILALISIYRCYRSIKEIVSIRAEIADYKEQIKQAEESTD